MGSGRMYGATVCGFENFYRSVVMVPGTSCSMRKESKREREK